MIAGNTLPTGYRPYQLLTVCSNKILDGGFLLAIGETIPVVIGSGSTPQVWLKAPSNRLGLEFVTIVEKSVSRHPLVRIVQHRRGLSIFVAETKLMEIHSDGTNAATVTKLDLRPMGIDVHGDSSELNAGGAHFRANTFAGGGTVISYGGL